MKKKIRIKKKNKKKNEDEEKKIPHLISDER
jgi:hypothetical protein